MRRRILPFDVEVTQRGEAVTARAGVPLVLEMMRALGLAQVIARQGRGRERQSGSTEAEKIEALVLLLAAAGGTVSTTSRA